MRIALEQMVSDGELTQDGAQQAIGRGDRLKAKAIAFYKTAIRELSEIATSCLKLISGGNELVIRKTTGKKIISTAKKLFPGWIDPDFTSYGCDVEGEAKPDTKVEVYEMIAAGDFQKIFSSFECDLDELTRTQEQIIAFVEDYENWLHPQGYATFFLFKANGQFFVASVSRYGRRLRAGVYRFSSDGVGGASYRDRVVVP